MSGFFFQTHWRGHMIAVQTSCRSCRVPDILLRTVLPRHLKKVANLLWSRARAPGFPIAGLDIFSWWILDFLIPIDDYYWLLIYMFKCGNFPLCEITGGKPPIVLPSLQGESRHPGCGFTAGASALELRKTLVSLVMSWPRAKHIPQKDETNVSQNWIE